MEQAAVFGSEPDLAGKGFDIHPIAIAYHQIGRCRGVNFDQGIAHLVAQARDIPVLVADKLDMAIRGQDVRIIEVGLRGAQRAVGGFVMARQRIIAALANRVE